MPRHEDYLALTKGARMHLRKTSDNQFYFRTSFQVKWFIWGAIAVVCLPAPLLMSVVLEGGERLFHLGSSIFLILFALVGLGVRRHLILDSVSGKLKLEKSWWGLGGKIKSESPLVQQRAVVAPIGELNEGCLLEIADQKYTIGSADEVRQVARFLQQYFSIPAFDRVAQWPKELKLSPLEDAVPESGAQPGPSDNPETDRRTSVNGVDTASGSADLDAEYASVMDARIFLRLALPFPAFIAIGVVLSMLANKGGV